MTNAAREFIEHIADRKVKCALIHDDADRYGGDVKQVILPVGHSEDDFNRFISQLNFNYDSGYGGQSLFGTIWYMDGSWSDRGEYDGSEWWNHQSVPEIPEEVAHPVFTQTNELLISKE